MLNIRPIFLNCFAHGGSGLLVNFLVSHPNVCISSGETHKVFKPGTDFDKGWPRIKKQYFYDYPIRLIAGEDLFSPKNLQLRKNHVPQFLRNYIDGILYRGRFDAMVPTHNFFQYENVPYTMEELGKCRLLTKGLNGLVFATDLFREMYPDAVFFGLVRNGFPLLEGRVRRGQSASGFAMEFSAVTERMLQLSEEMKNFHLLRFEDLVSDPVLFLRKVYDLAGLNVGDVRKVRMLTRPITDSKGNRSITMKGGNRELAWYTFEQFRQYIRPEINTNQAKLLSREDREAFVRVAGRMMERLGYAVD